MSEIFFANDDLAWSAQISSVDLPELRSLKIGAIVSLTENRPQLDDFPEMEILHLPLTGNVPELGQCRELFSFLRLMRRLGKKTLIYCSSGQDKSPTMVASYLIYSGMSPEGAIDKIREVSPRALTEEEIKFLKELPLSWMRQDKDNMNFASLIQLVKILRRRCPWDREQTHKSLQKNMIEEAWEAVEAIERGNAHDLASELGDVLLQVVFHSGIAQEEGEFSIDDVIKGISEKLIRRHPHVFTEKVKLSSGEVLNQWESLKEKEPRAESDLYRRYLPALMRADRLQEIASSNGLDWQKPEGILEKIAEEFAELRESLEREKEEEIWEELGDLLFSCVNLARFLKINPEEALHRSTDKFLKRYEEVLAKLRERGLDPKNLSIEEIDEIWNEIKKSESNR